MPMKKPFRVTFLLAILILLPMFAWAAPASVTIQFGDSGLTSLRYQGQEFLWLNLSDGSHGAFDGGVFWVSRVSLHGADGKEAILEGGGPSTVKVDAAHRSVTRTFAWGRVQGIFTPQGSRLNLKLTVTNMTSNSTVQSVVLQPMWLRFPERPNEYAQEYPLLTASLEQPGIVTASFRTGTVALCNEDFSQPLLIGFPFALNRPEDTLFPVRVATTPEDGQPSQLIPSLRRPIAPGSTQLYSLSLRFGPAGVSKLASDLTQRFAAAYPPVLHWADRRPVGYLMLSSTVPHPVSGKNPRGWFNNADDIDVTQAAGKAAFARRLMEYADTSVRILKAMHAQGMITWDIEGQEYPHATSYIGDPRKVKLLAPEMEPLADTYFARFRRAGLKVGVCVRPQLIVGTPPGDVSQQDPGDFRQIIQVLTEKMLYANKRWGCTLFYVDSNGDPNSPYPASVFQSVAAALARHKVTALIIPEHQSLRYYSVSAPYDEMRGGVFSTPESVRSVYPGAFSVLSTSDADLDAHHADIVAAIKRGDILLFRGWWDDPLNVKVKALLAEAGAERAIINSSAH